MAHATLVGWRASLTAKHTGSPFSKGWKMCRTNGFLTGITLCFSPSLFSQTGLSFQWEAGAIQYGYRTISIDPGPDWKGYYLPEKNGFDFHLSGGIHVNRRLFAGIGGGFLQIGDIQGVTAFLRTEVHVLDKKLSPVFGLKWGGSFVKNQYENGTRTMVFELTPGVRYRLSDQYALALTGGAMFTQQSLVFPVRLTVIGSW
jgi:hypothetical protein